RVGDDRSRREVHDPGAGGGARRNGYRRELGGGRSGDGVPNAGGRTGYVDPEGRRRRFLVPRDDGPRGPVPERHDAHAVGRAANVITDRAGAHVTAELSEHVETLRRKDLGDAVGREFLVVVQEAVV